MPDLAIFSTCPQSKDVPAADYAARVAQVARWSEAAGCAGILVYSDNGLMDPWLVSLLVAQATERLSPLVAVQPVYMHPYSAAKMVATITALTGRRLCLNMIAGGFKGDLEALCDDTPHDDRYLRLSEYTQIVAGLLAASHEKRAFSFEGKYYRVANLRMSVAVPPEFCPDVFVSGSSDAGLASARSLGAVAVQYPQPVSDYSGSIAGGGRYGIRVGIIAREAREQAWAVARARFPADRRGQIAHQLAMKKSDSAWHRQLSDQAEHQEAESVYWLEPFRNYKTFCPYLVGDYDSVAQEIARYMAIGYGTVILDIPPSEEELAHIGAVFARARRMAA